MCLMCLLLFMGIFFNCTVLSVLNFCGFSAAIEKVELQNIADFERES